jgi:hypothetical protein
MSQTRRVKYRVCTLRRGKWAVAEHTVNLDAALAKATHFLDTKRFERVKVEQEFTDPGAKRAVVTTLFEKVGTVPKGFEINVKMLLAMSVGLGIAMFFLMRYLLGNGLR